MNILSEAEREAAHARQRRRYKDEQALKQYSEREHLRSEIPSRLCIEVLKDILKIAHAGREDVITPAGEIITIELDRTRVASLGLARDVALKLLNKTIPDLKQIELRADVTEEVLPQTITYTVIRPEDDA